MKSWAKICLIVGASCTLAGAVLCGIGYVGHGMNYVRTADLNSLGSSASRESGTPVVLEKTKIDPFHSLDIDLEDLDLEILPSDDNNYYLSYNITQSGKSDPVDWKVEKDTLTLTENPQKRSNYYVHVDIGFLVNLFTQGEKGSSNTSTDTVCLYLPKKAVMSDLSVTSSYGDALLSGLSAQKGTIEIDSGNVDVENCTFTDCTLSSDYGDVDVTHSDLTACTITLSNGDIDCDDVVFSQKNQLSSNYGDISVTGKRQAVSTLTLTADTEFGDIDLPDVIDVYSRQSDGTSKYFTHEGKKDVELELHTDNGDIELE